MSTEITEEIVGLAVIQAKSTDIALVASSPIVDQDSYNMGVNTAKEIKLLKKEIESTFKPSIDNAHKAHKSMIDAMKKYTDPLDALEAQLKKTMLAYTDLQEKIRREEQRKAQAEALLAQQKAEAEAREAHAKAQQEARELAEANTALGLDEEPVIVPEFVIPTVALAFADTPVKLPSDGVSYREVWKFEIVDPLLIPREYLMIDDVKVGATVRSLKQLASIPGVRVYSEKTMSVRA